MIPKFRKRQLQAIGCLVLGLTALYFILALSAPVPGSDLFHRAYESEAAKMGVGQPYRFGPYEIGGLLFFSFACGRAWWLGREL